MTNSREMSQLGLATHTRLRALRGAITVDQDTPQAVEEAVAALISAIQGANCLSPDDVISAIFSVTPDIRSRNPATAARSHGWDQVPMLCVAELMVEDAMPRCIRLLVHLEMDAAAPLHHQYLHEARALRPDRAG
ncbi:MAG TPA: chorismate mutase [Gemmatimonadales bacterium]|nr:chorismate mutase [Gemmatimonadales bacterium]